MTARPALRALAAPPATRGGLRFPYGRQHVDEGDIEAVVAALRADLLTCGPLVPAFEAALGRVLGTEQVTACSNGTAALHLAYAALGLGAGDEIITTAITFSATASAAYQVGATVRFADVDPVTGNVDPASVAALIGPRTRAITVVHLAGLPVDLDELRELAADNGLFLVEDACHALGATYHGAVVGGAGCDAAVHSFHPVKHVTTGEGGAVVLRDPAHHRRAQRLRHHGIERDPAAMSRPSPGPWYHEVVEQGFNYRLADLNCALGKSQLARLPANLARRRAIAARYRAALDLRFGADGPVRAPLELADRESAYHLFAAALDFDALGVDRGALMTALAARGVGTQVHYIPLPMHPFHRARAGEHAAWPRPGADRYYQRTLSLPMYPQLTDADVDEIVAILAEVIAELRP